MPNPPRRGGPDPDAPLAHRDAPLTYRDAGVDIEAGDRLVDAIGPLARATSRPGAMGGLGGFAALFDPRAAGFADPILVAATDGVGTKLMVAIETGLHDEVGIDLVAMVVNDLVVQGATPLMFLDYFATGRLDVADAARVVAGIAEGCRRAGCALVGGETAEMPGLYAPGHYDLAGFAVGAAARDRLLPQEVPAGAVLLGLPSSGIHSNGFSLVRRVVEAAGAALDAPAPFEPGATLAAALMRPTRIYVPAVLALHEAGLLHAAAHVTGGGIPGNLPRVLAENRVAVIDEAAWTPPPVFDWLAREGRVARAEMRRVFNMGIGMVLAVSDPEAATALLAARGEAPVAIGRVEPAPGPARVRYLGDPA